MLTLPSGIGAAAQNLLFEQVIVTSNTAVLDNQIGSRCRSEKIGEIVLPIDDERHIVSCLRVQLLLAAVGIRLSEGNLMTQGVQMFVDATVIGSGAIPVT